jgi:hypothetical protein
MTPPNNGATADPVPDQKVLNREIEERWRRGEISFTNFDWWLRHMCGI